MAVTSSISEGGNKRHHDAFGHTEASEERGKSLAMGRCGGTEGANGNESPSNGEVLFSRTTDGPETFLEHGRTDTRDASTRNSDRLNPKEIGMIATTCTSMNALGKTCNNALDLPLIRRVLPRVLLASQSPRRRRMLTEHGIEHSAIVTGLDDGALIRGGVTPGEWVASLAYFKAAAAHERMSRTEYTPGELIILGADTVVRKGDRVIGQPTDAADAERIIRMLSNGRHEVLTGVAFIDAATGRRDMWVDKANVRVGDIGDERIAAYIASTDWKGKAGAYNLSERLEEGWPIEFEGDPATIMGLPMQRLTTRLLEFRDSCLGAAAN